MLSLWLESIAQSAYPIRGLIKPILPAASLDMSSDRERRHEEPPQDADAQLKYYAYCPLGDQCSKGSKTLGGFWNENAARNAIFTHLRRSTYHEELGADECKELAQDAEVPAHDWSAENEAPFAVPEDQRSSGSRPAPSAKTRARRPTTPSASPPRRSQGSRSAGRSSRRSRSRSRARRKAKATPAAADSQLVVAKKIERGIEVQTRNAISFCRAMTQAEKALKIAENVARRAMETFQDMEVCTCCGMTACGSTAKGFLEVTFIYPGP
jgi:hypothetical protein